MEEEAMNQGMQVAQGHEMGSSLDPVGKHNPTFTLSLV